jgi:hypothetical protein
MSPEDRVTKILKTVFLLDIVEHGGLGPTKIQKDVGEEVVGPELRVFSGWLQLTCLKQLGRWGLLGGLFWKDSVYANNLSQNPFVWLSIIPTNCSVSFNPRASSCQARVV